MPEIAILVTSLHKVAEEGVEFVFTDRNAAYATVRYASDLEELSFLPWDDLRGSHFQRDPNDPGRFERYMAEALIRHHLPTSALLGIGCHGAAQQTHLQKTASRLGIETPIVINPGWYV